MKPLASWLLLALFATTVVAEDTPAQVRFRNWPQWRGPLATGFAPQADPPLRWDEKTNIRWKVQLPGKGSSTPAIWEDRLFVQAAVDTKKEATESELPAPSDAKFQKRTKAPTTWHQFLVLCLDRNTGKLLWQRTACEAVPHEGHHDSHSYAAFSPTTDGKLVWAYFGSRGVYCYDVDGNLKWKRELGRMETRLGWGEAGVPVLHRDNLIVNFDHEGRSFLIVLDARTGATRWKVERVEPTSWATPLVVEHQGRTQVVVNGTNRVRSYDLASGEVIWECGGMTVNAIPCPVAADGVVYCMTGYNGSLAFAVPLDATGDLTKTEKPLWRYEKGTPYIASPLLVGDRLYFTQALDAILTSLDIKTGKPVIHRERLPGLTRLYASPTAAKDRIYVVDRAGTTLVLQRGDQFKVLAQNRLDDPIDASPVLVGRQLYLRSNHFLYCIEEK